MRNIIVQIFLTGCALIALTGCVPMSEHPVTSKESATIDKALLGVWQEHDADSLLIFLEADDHLQTIQIKKHSKERYKRVVFDAFSSKIDSGAYLNLAEHEDGKTFYAILRYRFDEQGRLIFSIMQREPIRQAIRDGVIAGENTDSDPIIREGSSGLEAYLNASGEGLFVNESEPWSRIM